MRIFQCEALASQSYSFHVDNCGTHVTWFQLSVITAQVITVRFWRTSSKSIIFRVDMRLLLWTKSHQNREASSGVVCFVAQSDVGNRQKLNSGEVENLRSLAHSKVGQPFLTWCLESTVEELRCCIPCKMCVCVLGKHSRHSHSYHRKQATTVRLPCEQFSKILPGWNHAHTPGTRTTQNH